MRHGIVVAVVALAATACGPRRPGPAPAVTGARVEDAASQLAARLPPGGDGCVVARVGTVPARRRDLVAPLSAASALAWASAAPIVAYAETSQGRRFGRSVRALLRVSDRAAARAWLVDGAPVRVVFGASEECQAGWRCWVAREDAEDARTLVLALGPWDSSRAGAGDGCVRAAQRWPQAIEVARVAVELPFETEADGLRLHLADTAILPSIRGLLWRRRLRRPSTVSPMEFEELVDLLSELEQGRFFTASRVRRWREGGVHHTEAAYLWEDLELARADRRRLRAALAEEARDELPLPLASVDIGDLRSLRHQIALRRRRMNAAPPARRVTHAQELRALLERAHEVFPGDEALARGLVSLLMREFGEGERAAAVTREMLALGVGDAEGWRLLRRQALAFVGVEALAAGLVEDGVLDRRRAREAAQVLVRFASDYELAEAAWIAARQARSLARRLRPVGGVRLPLTSLLDTLVVLADPDGPTKSIHAFLRIDAELPPGAAGPPDGRTLTWSEGGTSWRVGAERLDAPDHLRGLARGLFAELPDQVEAELLVAAVPFDGRLSEPSGAVRVRGRLEGGDFVLRQASMRLDWDAVTHYLAEPFAQLVPRLFPPPELALEAENAAEAQGLVERAADEPVLRCRASGDSVRCGVSPQLDVSRRGWRRVVWPRLEGRAITRP